MTAFADDSDKIVFKDPVVKSICLENWDWNRNGELEIREAKSVNYFEDEFQGKPITSFDEFKYFTGLTSIGRWAFQKCTKLESIKLPKTVTSIGKGAFDGCTSLNYIYIPKSVTSITDGAFSGCKADTINVDKENTRYDSRNDCNAIIDSQSNVLILGNKNTVIPNNVTTIGYGAFAGCAELTHIEIPSSVTSIEAYAFQGCKNLTSITIPNSVTNIGSNVFNNCVKLNKIKLPNALLHIGVGAFQGCGITNITIPFTITTIGDYAFANCKNLTTIRVEAKVPPEASEAFNNTNDCPISVPEDAVDLYRSSWSNYYERIFGFSKR